jgi:hypothetical protein
VEEARTAAASVSASGSHAATTNSYVLQTEWTIGVVHLAQPKATLWLVSVVGAVLAEALAMHCAMYCP